MCAPFAAVAGLLVSPEWGIEVRARSVQMDFACADSPSHRKGTVVAT